METYPKLVQQAPRLKREGVAAELPIARSVNSIYVSFRTARTIEFELMQHIETGPGQAFSTYGQ